MTRKVDNYAGTLKVCIDRWMNNIRMRGEEIVGEQIIYIL